MAMTLVSTVTVGSGGAATIEWTNIPQTGKDLLIVASLRTARSGQVLDDISFRLNGNSGSNYSYRSLYGTGSGVATNAETLTSGYFGQFNAAGATASTFGNGAFYLANYAGSTTKSISTDTVTENNATASFQFLGASLFNQTAAITSITLGSFNSQNFVEHSTASLYIIS